MVSLTALWLPILLAAVIVFIASFIMHMVLPYHHSDYKKMPEEDKIMGALRGVGLTKGLYALPYCTHKDMNSPEMKEKQKQGPVAMITVFKSGPPNMPKYLVQWFFFCLIVGFLTAYLTGRTVPAGEPYLRVFQVAGTAAFMAYGLGNLVNSVWKGQPWGNTIKEVIDGLIFGLLTAGTFGWLWPR
jgi:hypothetical protein